MGPPALFRSDAPEGENAYLKAVLEAVPAYVVMLDEELRIRYINRLQPGFALEDVLGRSTFDFVSPDFRARHREAIESALRHQRPEHYLGKAAGGDGETAFYDTRLVPVQEAGGATGLCLIAVDVTEHVARAEALRASEQKLRVAVEATGLGLWTWDLQTGQIEWNQRMLDIVGVPRPLIMADYIAQHVHPEDREWLQAEMERSERGEVPNLRVHRVMRGDGETRWVMPSRTSLSDASGRVTHVLGGLLDVTEQHLTHQRLRQAEKMSAVAELTAGVAHNFNNMLAVILPALELTRADVAEARRHLIDDAVQAARRAAELVKGLMAFAGQTRGSERKTTAVSRLVHSAVEASEQLIEPYNVQLGELPDLAVDCDGDAIVQVLIDLLLNARDALVAAERDTAARIALEASLRETCPPESEQARRFVRIAVADSGCGIEPAVAARMFDPFFTTKEPGKGTGLGLATSNAIVIEHGGFVSFETEPGRGSVFNVHLPISEGVEAAAGAEGTAGDAAAAAHVLVIDDEEAIRTVLAHFLADAGFGVALAGDVQSAIAELERGPQPDVVLLDRSMPGAPGTQALPEIRRRAPRAAVLYFTGQEVSPEECAEVEGVVAKPVAAHELIEIVRSHLR